MPAELDGEVIKLFALEQEFAQAVTELQDFINTGQIEGEDEKWFAFREAEKNRYHQLKKLFD